MKQAALKLIPFLVLAVSGVICTIVIAVAVAYYAPHPTRFIFLNEHTGQKVAAYRSLASKISDSERVVIMMSREFAYRSLDIRYYDAAEIAKTDYPPEKRRAYKTELGWPNAAFATNARNIGLRLGAGLGPNSPTDDDALHDGKETTVQILWAGFCLNSFLAATLFLLPLVLFRRLTNYSITTRSIIASVCIGLWLALITAWGCDLAHHVFRFLPRDYFGNSIGYNSRIVGVESELSLGWPAYCLRGTQIAPWQVLFTFDCKRRHIIALMAMPVWWQGMLINWMFYSLVIVIVVRGPATLRRLHRRRHNRCLMCGYPIGKSNRCSECGQVHPV